MPAATGTTPMAAATSNSNQTGTLENTNTTVDFKCKSNNWPKFVQPVISNSDQGHCSRTDNKTDNLNISKITSNYKEVKSLQPPTPTSPPPAHPRLWLPRHVIADQVIITDVTVNKETVTIRESKNEHGFFQPRHNPFKDT